MLPSIAHLLAPPLPWPLAIGIAIAVVVALEIVYRFSFSRLQRLAASTTTKLDDVLVRRLRLPAQVLVFLVGGNVLFLMRDIENASLSKLVTVVELMLLAYVVIEAVETAFVDLWLGEKKRVQIPSVVRGLALLVIYTAATLSVIGSVTGLNLAPVLATSTVLTVVLGLALQDTLGNLFGGLALSLEKPFAVGDWILVDGIEGRVTALGWRSVHLQTFSADIVTVPNAALAKARVQNFTRPDATHARLVEVIVKPSAAPGRVEEAAAAAFSSIAAIRIEPAPRAWLTKMTPLAHTYTLRVFINDFGQHDELESALRKRFVEEAAARELTVGAVAVAAVE